jgi:hypothetical protein
MERLRETMINLNNNRDMNAASVYWTWSKSANHSTVLLGGISSNRPPPLPSYYPYTEISNNTSSTMCFPLLWSLFGYILTLKFYTHDSLCCIINRRFECVDFITKYGIIKLVITYTLFFKVSLWVQQLQCKGDHSPPYSAGVKNTWSFASTFIYVLMAWYFSTWTISLTFYLPSNCK